MDKRGTVTAKSYEFHLEGVHATDVSLAVLRDLADLLLEGASRAARLAMEGRSLARGSQPAWLASAAEVRLVALREGSLALDCMAAPLQGLPEGLMPGATALDLFLQAAEDASNGNGDSERLDAGILQTLIKARSLFTRGVTRLRLAGSRLAVEVTAPTLEIFQRLASELPQPQVERCVGTLDSLTLSNRSCLVRLAGESPLRGHLASSIDLDEARALLGAEVLVEGTAFFRPSGRPHHMDVDYLAAAGPHDEVWRRSPRATDLRPRISSTEEPLSFSSFVGQWPGDETDEEIFAALRALS